MFDIFDDNGTLLKHYYPKQSDLPAYIRESGPLGPLSKLASDEFAAIVPVTGGVKRAYPMANDAATAISCLYFEHTHGNLSPEMQKSAALKLVDACKRFDLEPTPKVAELGTEYQEKEASANPLKIAFPSQGIEGTPWFPLSTEEQVKLAAENYSTIIRKLEPNERVQFTRNLMKQASMYGVLLPKTAELYGGDVLSTVAVIDAIEKRAAFMSEDQRQLLHKSADQILQMTPDKVADLLDQIDMELGLEVMYDTRIPAPQAIHAQSPAPVKTASLGDLEIPMESWEAACDAGVLSMFEPNIQTALRQQPDLLNNYKGTPVFDHVMDNLDSLGVK